MEIYCNEVQTEGRLIVFRVCKAHGQTPRLQVRQTLPPGHVGSYLDEGISICEEDIAVFIDGVLAAAASLGREPVATAPQTATEPYAEIRKTHQNAYRPWTVDEDARLRVELESRMTVKDIALAHKRQPSAMKSRIEKIVTKTNG